MRAALRCLSRRFSRPAAPESAVVVVEPQTADLATQLARFGAAWTNTMNTLGAALTPALSDAAEALARFVRAFSPYYAANQPVHVAGLEARYFVRAGLDPSYADPRALDQLVQQIMTGAGDLLFVSDENRALIASAALRGWVGSHAGDTTVRVLAWHRQIGSTAISVGRAS